MTIKIIIIPHPNKPPKEPETYIFRGKNALQEAEELITKKYSRGEKNHEI